MQPVHPMAAELCRGVRRQERPCCSLPSTLAHVRGTDDLLFRVLTSHASTVCMSRDGETYTGKVKKSSTYINRILIVFGLELSGFMIFPHSLLTLSFHLEFTQMKIQVQLWL